MVRDVLFVVDGRVATSAGIASGIDLALHLVAAWTTALAVAARVARGLLVVPARRNGSGPAGLARCCATADHLADLVHRAQDVLDASGSPSRC